MSKVDDRGDVRRSETMLRRNREEYLRKESELVKKHNLQLRDIAEQHQAEVDRIKAQHNAQMDEYRNYVTKERQERDQSYRDEIEEIRLMHRDRLKNAARENEKKLEASRDVAKTEAQLAKERYDERVADLNIRYEDHSQRREQSHQKQLHDLRDKQKQAVIKNRDYQQQRHKQELESVNTERRRTTSELKRKLHDAASTNDLRLKTQQLQHLSDKQRITKNFIEQVNREREARLDSEKVLRDGFQDGLDNVRQRYQAADDKRNEVVFNNQKALRERVDGMLNGDVRALEVKVEKLKGQNARDKLNADRKKEREVASLRNEYHKKVGAYEDLNRNLREDYKSKNTKEIDVLNKKNSELLKDTNRFHRIRRQAQGQKAKEHVTNVEIEHKAAINQQKSQAENRFERMQQENLIKREKLGNYYAENLHSIKENYDRDLIELKDKMDGEKLGAVSRLKKQVRDFQVQSDERFAKMVEKYERLLSSVRDKNVKDKRTFATKNKVAIKNLQKSNQLQIDTLKSNYESKLAEVQEQHDREIQRVQQKHKEQLDGLLSSIRTSQQT